MKRWKEVRKRRGAETKSFRRGVGIGRRGWKGRRKENEKEIKYQVREGTRGIIEEEKYRHGRNWKMGRKPRKVMNTPDSGGHGICEQKQEKKDRK